MKIVISIGILLAIGLVGMYLFTNTPTNRTSEPAAQNELMEQAESTEVTVELETDSPAPASESIDESTGTEFIIDAFNFGYSTEEIRVPAGAEVTVTLTNSDGYHDWVVDEFDAATDKISAGETTSVTFTADTPGTYEFYCSVGNHRAEGMVGNLIVE